MRKIKIIEQISLDGVIQASGGRDEDGDYATLRHSRREPGRSELVSARVGHVDLRRAAVGFDESRVAET